MASINSGSGTLSTPAPALADAAKKRELEEEVALCLSGGGYRAMLFHMGALLRLNDAGLLRRLARVSSVSGGSLTAGRPPLLSGKMAIDVKGDLRGPGLGVRAAAGVGGGAVAAGAGVTG